MTPLSSAASAAPRKTTKPPDDADRSLSPSSVDVDRGPPGNQAPAHMAVQEGRTARPEERWHPWSITGLLDEVLAHMYSEKEASALSHAFVFASDRPPITTQSLSELDVPNIFNSISLRHDLSFDRDVRFRPNLDGTRGDEKRRAMKMYWDAVVAELSLYAWLFHGTPQLNRQDSRWPELVAQAKRRIPLMFDTIKDVLKSGLLVNGHSRVDETLDVPMLMQQVERGVVSDSSLVRLAEQLGRLLKEHCAPIRDRLVDRMVEEIGDAVTLHDYRKLVNGLCRLVEILEAMKLDIANHQIRYLRARMIDSTVHFERTYHLERLVHGQSRIDIGAAQRWYRSALSSFQNSCTSPPKLAYLEILTRAVTSAFFQMHPHLDLPETFYLDYDRLRLLAWEVSDLVHFQICFDAFDDLCMRIGFNCSQLPSCGRSLQHNILAITGERNASDSWRQNSKDIAVTLMRQLASLKGIDIEDYGQLVQNMGLAHDLHASFERRSAEVLSRLQSRIMPRVLASVRNYSHASTVELFNAFAIASETQPRRSSASLPFNFTEAPASNSYPDTLSSPFREQECNIADQLVHVIVLHWQTWADIAYITPETPPELQSRPRNFSGESTLPTTTTPAVASVSSATASAPAQVQAPAPSLSSVPPVSELIEIRRPQNSSQEALGFAGPSVP